MENVIVAKLEQKGCKCDETHVRVFAVDIRPHELEEMDVFYCPTNNLYWFEP